MNVFGGRREPDGAVPSPGESRSLSRTEPLSLPVRAVASVLASYQSSQSIAYCCYFTKGLMLLVIQIKFTISTARSF